MDGTIDIGARTPDHSGDLLTLVQSFFYSREENRCGLLQSGKVVGVVLDLRLSLQDNLVIHLLAVRAT